MEGINKEYTLYIYLELPPSDPGITRVKVNSENQLVVGSLIWDLDLLKCPIKAIR